jgi:hypothetical protein
MGATRSSGKSPKKSPKKVGFRLENSPLTSPRLAPYPEVAVHFSSIPEEAVVTNLPSSFQRVADTEGDVADNDDASDNDGEPSDANQSFCQSSSQSRAASVASDDDDYVDEQSSDQHVSSSQTRLASRSPPSSQRGLANILPLELLTPRLLRQQSASSPSAFQLSPLGSSPTLPTSAAQLTPFASTAGFGVPQTTPSVFLFGQSSFPGVAASPASSASGQVFPFPSGMGSSSTTSRLPPPTVPTTLSFAPLSSAEAIRRETAGIYMQHLRRYLQLIEANTVELSRVGLATGELQYLHSVRSDLERREQNIQSSLAIYLDDLEARQLQCLLQSVTDLVQHIVRRH